MKKFKRQAWWSNELYIVAVISYRLSVRACYACTDILSKFIKYSSVFFAIKACDASSTWIVHPELYLLRMRISCVGKFIPLKTLNDTRARARTRSLPLPSPPIPFLYIIIIVFWRILRLNSENIKNDCCEFFLQFNVQSWKFVYDISI